MDDLGLYQRLLDGSVDASDVDELAALAARTLGRRAPFFGVIDSALTHVDPALRAAGLRILGGGDGRLGLQCLLDAFVDPDSGVRAAAVSAFRESCTNQPLRWAHTLFHPSGQVRSQALVEGAPAGAEKLEPFLLADPLTKHLLVARMSKGEVSLDARAISLLLPLWRNGELDADAAFELLASLGPKELFWAAASGAARSVSELGPAFPVIDVRERDGFDELFGLVCAASEAARLDFCQRAERVIAKLADVVRVRLAVSILAIHPELETLGLPLARLLVIAHPECLGWPELPVELRRSAALALLEERNLPKLAAAPVALFLAELVPSEDTLDLRVATAVLRLLAEKPFSILVNTLDVDRVVAAFAREPLRSSALLSLSDDTKRGKSWFLGEISTRGGVPPGTLNAIVAWVTPLDRLDFIEKLDPLGALALAIALVDLEIEPTVQLKPNRVQHLAGGIIARFCDGTNIERQTRLLTRYLAHLTQLAVPEDHTFGFTLLGEAGRALDADAFVAAFLALDTERLLRALAIVPNVSRIPFGKELALAHALGDHPDALVRAWAGERISKPTVITPVTPITVTSRALTTKELQRISRGSMLDLESTLTGLGRVVHSGLTAALAARSPAMPSVEACVALLASGDPPHEVAHELERFLSRLPTFLGEVDRRATDLYSSHAELPLVGAAWLWRWDKQAFRVGELVSDIPGGLVQALRGVLVLPSAMVREHVFRALGSCFEMWCARDRARLGRAVTDDGTELATLCVDELGTDVEAGATAILCALHTAGYPAVLRLKAKVAEKLPDVDDSLRWRLEKISSAAGLASRTAVRLRRIELAPDERARIRAATDLDELTTLARDPDIARAEEAMLRLVELGGAGCGRLAELLTESPYVTAHRALLETLALWPECPALGAVRALVDSTTGELRFRLAFAFAERGDEAAREISLESALESGNWFSSDDWSRFLARMPAGELARRLATSPQPHAYRPAVEILLGEGDLPHLRAFLATGSDRLHALRLDVAKRLLADGDAFGLPLLLELALDTGELPPRALTDDQMARATTAILRAGPRGGFEIRLMTLLDQPGTSRTARADAYQRMIVTATNAEVARRASSRLMRFEGRDEKLQRVANVFAWGTLLAPVLTGRRLRVHMTDGRKLGYTWLDDTKIYVSPLPILRGDAHGETVVEGLVLHELGHHRHHAKPEDKKAWKEAETSGIFGLLNLVADEHLERNLRALDPELGDRLKKLASYAFQHSDRDVHVLMLTTALGAHCFPVLSTTKLELAYTPDAIRVSSGVLLSQMERAGSSFARFFRALRMGLGNRHRDPVVEEALGWFGKQFRHSTMPELLALARRLQNHFGFQAALSNSLGGHEIGGGLEREHAIDDDGIGDDEVQQEVERVLDPRERSARTKEKGGKPAKLWINVSGAPHFERIYDVKRIPRDPDAHRAVAHDVIRHSRRLRRYLEELGLSHTLERRRLRGTRVDRHELINLVLHGEPRVLVRRELVIDTDLFIGVAVDCSGSMASGQSMEKAKRFAVLLAESVRDLPGVDLRVFGFTDSVIYDAADAAHSAAASLPVGGGNNDAAGLLHVAEVAKKSRRRGRLLVMISDGLPTECSTDALKALVTRLERREKMCVAQVAVRPLEEQCFRNYVLIEGDLDATVSRFGRTVARLVRRALV
jgi:hypothetical protein